MADRDHEPMFPLPEMDFEQKNPEGKSTRLGRVLCYFNFHKHPESSAPAWWTCEREGCGKTFHQKW